MNYKCPVCQWAYDPDAWGSWHEVPGHNCPPCEGGGIRTEVPTPCRAALQVYVKEIRNGVAVVFVQSEQAVDHYPFTVPVDHLSGYRMIGEDGDKALVGENK